MSLENDKLCGGDDPPIYRMVNANNLELFLADGSLRCQAGASGRADYIRIGEQGIIDRRGHVTVPATPGGLLNHYIPFYFTPHSPMQMRVITGRVPGVEVKRRDLIFFVTRLSDLERENLLYVTTDKNAVVEGAKFFPGQTGLREIDWVILKNRDFTKDLEDPGKMERYQAECLVHRSVPWQALRAIVCYEKQVSERILARMEKSGINIPVETYRRLYF